MNLTFRAGGGGSEKYRCSITDQAPPEAIASVRIAFSSPVSIVAAHTVRIHSHGMHCNQQPETGRKPLALIAASHWAPIPIVLSLPHFL
jgi:hypothetical protein